MADYKGIYYKNENRQTFYEGGAHFDYNRLYKILEKLSLEQKKRTKRDELIKNREQKNKELYRKSAKSIETREKKKIIVSYYCIYI